MEETILDIIHSWGFQAEKIKETCDESPDYLVDDGGALYLVELKIKEDDGGVSKERDTALSLGELYAEHMPLVARNRLSGIIRKAQSQLSAKNGLKVDFRLVWLAAVGRHQEAKSDQFFATLYGSTNIFDLDSDDGLTICYFFRNEDFFRYRNVLDGAILSWENSAILCLNPYSARCGELKRTRLSEHFGDAIRDPIDQERLSRAYIADCGVDRRNEQEVLNYLIGKYNREKILNILDMGYHSATVAVPHDKA